MRRRKSCSSSRPGPHSQKCPGAPGGLLRMVEGRGIARASDAPVAPAVFCQQALYTQPQPWQTRSRATLMHPRLHVRVHFGDPHTLRCRSSGKQVSGGAPADQPTPADMAAGVGGENSNSASAQGPLAQVRGAAAQVHAVAGVQCNIDSCLPPSFDAHQEPIWHEQSTHDG